MIKYDFDLIGKNVSSISWPIKLLVDLKSMDKGNSGEVFYLATLHKDPEYARSSAEKWLNEHYPSETHKKVRLVSADMREIQAFLNDNKDIQSITKTKDYEGSIETETDVNKILDELIAQAKTKRASDIHIIQTEQTVEVKLRVDGVLQISHILEKSVGDKLFPRIKGLTGMDITQTRTSQDGGFSQIYKGRVIDFRVGVKPIKGGEKITIRILDREDPSVNKDIDSLGLPMHILGSWKKLS
jgi:type II secretory ATPase GspE/PulE/Tfp pilus assembly ATPase PilB-like protein